MRYPHGLVRKAIEEYGIIPPRDAATLRGGLGAVVARPSERQRHGGHVACEPAVIGPRSLWSRPPTTS
jgi:hypothetical protein